MADMGAAAKFANWQRLMPANTTNHYTIFFKFPPVFCNSHAPPGFRDACTMHTLVGIFYDWLYQLDSHAFFEVRMRTWLNWGLIVGAVLMLLGRIPGGLVISLIFVGIILLLALGSHWARRGYYIHFVPEKRPHPQPSPLSPEETIPHRASGHFIVEERAANWTDLAANYRTFPDREHLCMAQVQPTTCLKVGQLNLELLGMWYFFIKEENIRALTPGRIYFGSSVEPGLRLRYQRPNKRGKMREDIFYLHFDSETHRQRVWADLLVASVSGA